MSDTKIKTIKKEINLEFEDILTPENITKDVGHKNNEAQIKYLEAEKKYNADKKKILSMNITFNNEEIKKFQKCVIESCKKDLSNKYNYYRVLINNEEKVMCYKCYETKFLNKIYRIDLYINILNKDNDLIYFNKIKEIDVTLLNYLNFSLSEVRKLLMINCGYDKTFNSFIKQNEKELLKTNWVGYIEPKLIRTKRLFKCDICGNEFEDDNFTFNYKNNIYYRVCNNCKTQPL